MITNCLPDPGPLLLDIATTGIQAEDCDFIRHPLVGGVVLFARNYVSREQLGSLIADLRAARGGPLLIAVDQEGGRVQRFRDDFTIIPAMRRFGQLYDRNSAVALELLRRTGCLLATELASCGVDFSFTPVIDLDYGCCPAIGDRALHRQPQATIELAEALIRGLGDGGFASVLKHFPGHGAVDIDSHLAIPRDSRTLAQIEQADLAPFARLCNQPRVAVMPGHVVYPALDERPASLSARWLQDILRARLQFDGAILSDDLHMNAATDFAGPVDAAELALEAGCDCVLICNDRPAVQRFLDNHAGSPGSAKQYQRRLSMLATPVDSASLDFGDTRDQLQQMVPASL